MNRWVHRWILATLDIKITTFMPNYCIRIAFLRTSMNLFDYPPLGGVTPLVSDKKFDNLQARFLFWCQKILRFDSCPYQLCLQQECLRSLACSHIQFLYSFPALNILKLVARLFVEILSYWGFQMIRLHNWRMWGPLRKRASSQNQSWVEFPFCWMMTWSWTRFRWFDYTLQTINYSLNHATRTLNLKVSPFQCYNGI